jgi:hypothetical protein
MIVHDPPMTSEPEVTSRSAQMSTSLPLYLFYLTPLIDEYHEVLYSYFEHPRQGSSFAWYGISKTTKLTSAVTLPGKTSSLHNYDGSQMTIKETVNLPLTPHCGRDPYLKSFISKNDLICTCTTPVDSQRHPSPQTFLLAKRKYRCSSRLRWSRLHRSSCT